MHDVAIGDDVFLAFQPQLAGVARTGFAAEREVVVIANGLGADEAALEIGMDRAGRLWRLAARGNGPGTGFFRTGGKKRDEMKEVIAGADQPVKARLCEPHSVEIFSALLSRQHRNLGL